MTDPILAPCRDNPAVMMRRSPDGCIYCNGPRVERTGLMPRSDMAERDASRRICAIDDLRTGSWLDYGCGQAVEYRGAGHACDHDTAWDPATGKPEPEDHYDIVTLFHVIEHVDDPVALLRHVRERFTPRTIVVETPNARDWMLDVCEPYRRHWCWTDHRMVFTAEALICAIAKAGDGVIETKFIQRYPAGNALRWLAEGKPGGHVDEPWSNVCGDYADGLGDRTDTLWCEWRVA
jgi:hypothetical protein